MSVTFFRKLNFISNMIWVISNIFLSKKRIKSSNCFDLYNYLDKSCCILHIYQEKNCPWRTWRTVTDLTLPVTDMTFAYKSQVRHAKLWRTWPWRTWRHRKFFNHNFKCRRILMPILGVYEHINISFCNYHDY